MASTDATGSVTNLVLHVLSHACGHALIRAPVPYHVAAPVFVCLVTNCAQKHLFVVTVVPLFVVKCARLLMLDARCALLSNEEILWWILFVSFLNLFGNEFILIHYSIYNSWGP